MYHGFSVHIALSDSGWILEKLAEKLARALPYVHYDVDVDSTADIQYYMTYGVWRSRVSPKEAAYFAHLEKDAKTQEVFYHVARNVDYSICHSKPYENILRDAGIDQVRTISPGVDLLHFQPRVKIGVVGRTYHTGRKGEGIVEQVMNIPGIDWFFTGDGWPLPGLNLRDDQMPDFYNSMDYILVPSLYEGGPMSVIEALACGCEVIAPPVGWVPEFPHIEYKTGDVEDLRRVLTEVVSLRNQLRSTVIDRGWDAWSEHHDEVFQDLARQISGKTSVSVPRILAQQVKRPALMIHGTEKTTDKGGPSVRAPKTALRLSRVGYEASIHEDMNFEQREHDLYHVYNVWHPKTCRKAMQFAKMGGAPVVLSTIYLDLSERSVFNQEVTGIFRSSINRSAINGEFARLRQRKLAREGLPLPEPYDGYHADVCGLVEMADHVIFLSEFERNALRAIGADMSASSVVLNPVEASLYAKPDPTLFQQAFGVSDYVLCVGRLEARKNQITLLHAMRESNIPVVLVGHAADPQYEKLLRSVAGPNVIFAGRIGSNSAMLGSAYAGARLTCQPSWSEGAPLVALEAAAAGCNMILSDRSSEQEYFGARARYVDPANPEQMLATILEAYESPFDDAQREELHHWTSENFNWERHIEGTAAAYERAAAEVSARRAPSAPTKVYVDLTSSANRSGPPSGIARVEERYARELYDLMPDQVQFVLWNGDRQQFVEVSPEQFERAEHRLLCGNRAPDYLFNSQDFHPAGLVQFEPNSVLLVLGGAWIRNARYVQSLVATKREMGLTFVAFIHDVIQAKFKHWFPDKVGDEFSENCRLLIDSVDHVLVNSQCTLRDVREFCDGTGLIPPPMDFVRFGDEIDTSIGLLENPQYDRVVPLLNGRDFILCVSAIDIRKNHVLLYNIWERLIEEYGEKTPHLIMVGSKGWSIDPFLESVAKNKTLQKYFHILNGINDATLDWLYRNSLFTVYPSLYEDGGCRSPKRLTTERLQWRLAQGRFLKLRRTSRI